MFKASNSRRIDNPDAADPDDALCSSSAPRIKIGVVENDMLVCEGLMALLNTVDEFDCIGAWMQVREALIALQELRPDVLLTWNAQQTIITDIDYKANNLRD